MELLTQLRIRKQLTMPDRYGTSMKAHLRDSVRTQTTLQHYLSREALPQIDNYNIQQYFNANGGAGARPTLDEVYLGEKRIKDKVDWYFEY